MTKEELQILKSLDLHINHRATASSGGGCGSGKVQCTTSIITSAALGETAFIFHMLHLLSEESLSSHPFCPIHCKGWSISPLSDGAQICNVTVILSQSAIHYIGPETVDWSSLFNKQID